jgi:UDP-glucose 4-epimerase
MKVLVTGGAGYLGSELVYKLSKIESVDEVVVYDNLSKGNFNLFISTSNKLNNTKVRLIHGDLLDSRTLGAAMKGVDIVYHLAAKTNTPNSSSDSSVFEQTNHWGTAEVVYAAEEHNVKKFIYTSSTAIYQGGKEDYANEESTLNPRDFYAIGKMRGESHVARLMSKMNTIILRVGNVYGYSPAIRFDSVINKFLFDSQFNGRISIHGSGRQIRPFIHINKVVDSLLFNIENTLPSDIYNLSDKNCKILDLVDIFKATYPALEFIFINQHIEMKNLKVENCTKIKEFIPIAITDLQTEIETFKAKNFAF